MKQVEVPMRTVRLYGRLGARFGRVHRIAVSSAAEAVRAMEARRPGFAAYIAGSADGGQGYMVLVGKRHLSESEINFPANDDIRIAPVLKGAKNGGIFNIILGVALIAASFFLPGSAAFLAGVFSAGVSIALGGIVQLLSPQPKDKKKEEDEPNYAFNGPVNTQAQGYPVPVLYGRLIVGSAVVSAGIDTQDAIYLPTGATDPFEGMPSLIRSAEHYRGRPDVLYLHSSSGDVPTLSGNAMRAVASVDGKVLVGQSLSNHLKIWRWNSTLQEFELMTLTGDVPGGSSDSFRGPKVTANGEWVVVPSPDNNAIYVYQFDGVGYTCMHNIAFGSNAKWCCFSPDESQIAIMHNNGTVRYDFNNATGALTDAVGVLYPYGDSCGVCDWVGNYIFESETSGTEYGNIRDATTMLPVCPAPVIGLSTGPGFFSPSGDHVYYSDNAGRIIVCSFDGVSLTNTDIVASDGTLIWDMSRRYFLHRNYGSGDSQVYEVAGNTVNAIGSPITGQGTPVWVRGT